MSTQQYPLSSDEPGSAVFERARLLYVTCAQYSEEWNCAIHSHACTELFFITGGRGIIQLQDEHFPVSVNDMVVINPNVPHTETSQSSRPMEYVCLGVEGLETPAGARGCSLIPRFAEQSSVSVCLRMLIREVQTKQAAYNAVCQNLLHILLMQLRRREEFTAMAVRAGPKSSRECSLVRRYIDEHFKENITLDSLADMAHLSKFYLAHSFQREYGISPIRYLLERRIRESRFMLSETDYSLSHIAQVLGFSSSAYFSQCFRRVENISPIEYRRRHHMQSDPERCSV